MPTVYLAYSQTITTECDVVDVYKVEIVQNIPISTEQLAQATAKDTQIQEIIKAIRGKKEIPSKLRFNIN